jgi:hypothetical protein
VALKTDTKKRKEKKRKEYIKKVIKLHAQNSLTVLGSNVEHKL